MTTWIANKRTKGLIATGVGWTHLAKVGNRYCCYRPAGVGRSGQLLLLRSGRIKKSCFSYNVSRQAGTVTDGGEVFWSVNGVVRVRFGDEMATYGPTTSSVPATATRCLSNRVQGVTGFPFGQGFAKWEKTFGKFMRAQPTSNMGWNVVRSLDSRISSRRTRNVKRNIVWNGGLQINSNVAPAKGAIKPPQA